MKTMLSRPGHHIIIALMLFMQLATVVHAVEHQEDEHTEHCAAFITAEQVVDFSTQDVVIADGPKLNACVLARFESYTQPLSVYQHSRAPPLH